MNTLIKIIKSMKGYYKYFVVSIFAMIAMSAAQLYIPLITRTLLKLVEKGDQHLINKSIILGLILFALYLLQTIGQYFKTYYTHYAAWNSISEIRSKLYNHIQYLSLSYFHDKQVGQLMSRITADTSNFEVLMAHALPDTILNIVIFIGSIIILFSINVVLALYIIASIPITILFVWIYNKKVRPLFKIGHKKMGDLNAVLQDNLSGVKEIQAFNKQKQEYQNVEYASKQHVHYILSALKKGAVFHPLISFVNNIGSVIIITVGGIMAYYGKISAADIVAFMMYTSLFYQPVLSIGRVSEEIQTSLTAAERVFEVLDEKSEVIEKDSAYKLKDINGEIEFKNVSFSYNNGIDILKNISIKINPGETIALVGPTGVGKTTFISLVARFYDPDMGNILIDGHDIKDVTLKSLRDNISVVLQDVFLFNGTVYENIAYGLKGATKEQVFHAAKIANAHSFIMNMENGYDTYIGERGTKLSGGQKQRLSIARAVLRNSPILILDEATASVDTNTERQIQQAIDKVSKDRTTIIIAHRLTTIKNADRIVVLSENGIEEQGTHDELIKNNGMYLRLVNG